MSDVNAVHSHDFINIIQTGFGLDQGTDQSTFHRSSGLVRRISARIVVMGTAKYCTADATWGISRPTHQLPGLTGATDHLIKQTECAYIQHSSRNVIGLTRWSRKRHQPHCGTQGKLGFHLFDGKAAMLKVIENEFSA